jgi:hypothetical protein
MARGRLAVHGVAAAVALAAVLVIPGFLPGSSAATSGGAKAGTSEVRASHDGLTVELRAMTPSPRSRAPVRLTVTADDVGARGALRYVLTFGDGASRHNLVPQFCTSNASHRRARWSFTHRYSRRGAYHVSVKVSASCSPASVTARLRLEIDKDRHG